MANVEAIRAKLASLSAEQRAELDDILKSQLTSQRATPGAGEFYRPEPTNIFTDSAIAGMGAPSASSLGEAGQNLATAGSIMTAPGMVMGPAGVLAAAARKGLGPAASALGSIAMRGAVGAGAGALVGSLPVVGMGAAEGAKLGAMLGAGQGGTGALWKHGKRKKMIEWLMRKAGMGADEAVAPVAGKAVLSAEEQALARRAAWETRKRTAAKGKDVADQVRVEEQWRRAMEVARKKEVARAATSEGRDASARAAAEAKAAKEGISTENAWLKAQESARAKEAAARAVAEGRAAKEGISTEQAWLKAQEAARKKGVPSNVPAGEAQQRAAAEAASVQEQIAVENQWLAAQAKAAAKAGRPAGRGATTPQVSAPSAVPQAGADLERLVLQIQHSGGPSNPKVRQWLATQPAEVQAQIKALLSRGVAQPGTTAGGGFRSAPSGPSIPKDYGAELAALLGGQ